MKKKLINVFCLVLFLVSLGFLIGCIKREPLEPTPEYKATAGSYVKNAKIGDNTAYISFEGFIKKYITGSESSEGQTLVIEILDEFQKTHQVQILSYNVLIDGGADPEGITGICITFFKSGENKGGGPSDEKS